MSQTGMSMEDWRQALRTAATIWNFDDFLAVDTHPTPTETWWAALNQFETADVCEAFSRLALTLTFRPSLAEVVAATRECAADRQAHERRQRSGTVVRLAQRPEPTVEACPAKFDQGTHQWRQEVRAEYLDFARRHQVDGAMVEREVRALDEDGPFARRARELIAGNVEPGVGIDAMLRAYAEQSPTTGDEDAASCARGA